MTTNTNRSAPKTESNNIHMTPLKCKNCGAPMDEGSFKCEYCGTGYVVEKTESCGPITEMNKLIDQANGILTPNEARRYLNLDGVEEVYSAYDSDGMLIKQIVKENTPSEAERYLKEGIISKDEIVEFLNLDEA